MGERHVFTNRLIKEKSPYLLQHAHNPVDWYPWGEEATGRAKATQKPIFLSIGYATCHWCHTMETESFENPAIAELMNEAFINIKVDREELPEVDALYMEFAQSMMAGASGWPLNIFLTPDLEPFFAATYLPPFSQDAMMGLTELIQHIKELWDGGEREKIEVQAAKIVEFFAEHQEIKGENLPEKHLVEDLSEIYYKIADPIYGGFKGAPKFPVGYQYLFLLICSSVLKDGRALFLMERTLDMMQRGGIYDHIGGGFSRYSVDERWLIPHFEKMLYDNALLSEAYANAWRYTQKDLYKKIACEVIDYVLRDMTHPEGGFYSAEDADSEGHEGLFYIWKYHELENILGNRLETFAQYYGVTREGNFDRANVLHTPLNLEEFAEKHHKNVIELSQELEEDRQKLFAAREKRIRPLKDDKILTSWNSLMIHALVEAGSAFNMPRYIEAAKKGIDFLRKYLWHGTELKRRWRDSEALHQGGLDDYVYLIRALLTLFERGEGSKYLTWAVELTHYVEGTFKAEEGAFYQTDGEDALLIFRKMSFSDAAEPSGNAIHAENLIRLYRISNDRKYLLQAEDILKAAKESIENYPPGYFYHIMNVGRYYDTQSPTWIIRFDEKRKLENEIKSALAKTFRPYDTIIFCYPEENLESHIPSLESYPLREGTTTLYECHQGRCLAPKTDKHEILEALLPK